MTDDLQSGAAKHGAESPLNRTASATNWPLLGTIALITWSCLHFPQATLNQYPDPSWMAVLINAHEKGMQFGRDIVYTYGPLGFLSIECFSPHAAVARIFFEIALGFGIATGLCLVAWRMRLAWRLVALGFFFVVSSSTHWGGDALFLDLGLFVWALLCFLESGPRLRWFVQLLVVLAAIGSLIKFTFLVTALFTIGWLACDLVLRRRHALAAGTVIGLVGAFLAGWLLLGQSLSGLGAFLSTSYSVATGYNTAMGASDVKIGWILVMTVAALAAVTIRIATHCIAGDESRAKRRGALLAWTAGLLFMEWKYACVRSDWDHTALMLGVVPIIAVSMEALQAAANRATRAVFWSRAACLLSMAGAILFIQSQVSGFALSLCVKRTGKNMTASLGVLMRPAKYLREKTEAFEAEQKREQLPKIRAEVGHATADIYGQNQSFAMFNELNYRPRPVFQSYSVYSRPLMELNERFYMSPEAPEYVLFNLQALDGRLPPLEDGLVLRDLLANYAFVLSEADYLLLRRTGTTKAQSTLVKEGTVHAGEKIDLEDTGDPYLWLEIELRPTLFGRLRQFLYKPPDTQLAVWSQIGQASPIIYRAPAIMLSAGFLMNPLLIDDEDMKNFYTHGKIRRVGAFSVQIPAIWFRVWQPQVHFRIYRIEK